MNCIKSKFKNLLNKLIWKYKNYYKSRIILNELDIRNNYKHIKNDIIMLIAKHNPFTYFEIKEALDYYDYNINKLMIAIDVSTVNGEGSIRKIKFDNDLLTKEFLDYVDFNALCPTRLKLSEDEKLCEEGADNNCKRCWIKAIKNINKK